MPAAVRHALILGALGEVGAVTVADVAQRLGVSDMTIRRDLGDLEREGRLSRTHGGAVRAGRAASAAPRLIRRAELRIPPQQERARQAAPSPPRRRSPPRARRRSRSTSARRPIWLAGLLAERRQAKIFTNSLRIAAQARRGPRRGLSARRPPARRRDDDLRPLGDRTVRGSMVRCRLSRRLGPDGARAPTIIPSTTRR